MAKRGRPRKNTGQENTTQHAAEIICRLTDDATPEIRKRTFIAAYIETAGVIGDACKITGVDIRTPYQWRREDVAFAQQWEIARDLARLVMVDESKRRAMRGSDTLLKFELQAEMPNRYRKRVEITPAAHTAPVSDVLESADRYAAQLLIGGPAKAELSQGASDHRVESEPVEHSTDPQSPVE